MGDSRNDSKYVVQLRCAEKPRLHGYNSRAILSLAVLEAHAQERKLNVERPSADTNMQVIWWEEVEPLSPRIFLSPSPPPSLP